MVITSTTYREQIEPRRDVLAAFSALDHGTTVGMTPEQVGGAYGRLLARLSVLLFLHGAAAARDFLVTLADADGDDLVALVSSFLETGSAGDGTAAVSELQQELVHFSRIVDLGDIGLAEQQEDLAALHRLRNSRRLPHELKVLSELLIVARSRMLGRGADLAVPRLRTRPAVADDITDATCMWTGGDYGLVVVSPRRRTRREIGFLHETLLCYLTPTEATVAVWAYASQLTLRAPLDVFSVAATGDGQVQKVWWSLPTGTRDQTDADPAVRCLHRLPAVGTATRTDNRYLTCTAEVLAITGTSDRLRVALLGDENSATRTFAMSASASAKVASVDTMARRARRLVTEYRGPDVVSIECGHIHLDRDLDVDQEVGARLGATASEVLAGRQCRGPVYTPMVDDDHVLVRLRPQEYRTFLQPYVGDSPMHLIVESSPIVRSVVTALWRRMQEHGMSGRTRVRGANLFLRLGDGGEFCELFENYQHQGGPGPALTGCVFFEAALLVYRTAPARFDTYFRGRFGLDVDVHDRAAELLGTPGSHDDRLGRLAEYYARFSAVTDIRRPDPDVSELVTDVLAGIDGHVAHLNVLEDYYEVQQGKVRALLRLLDLPLRLVTIHFNARTGRVIIDE